MLLDNQFRCGFGGPYAFDMCVARQVAEDIGDELGITRDYLFYRKLKAFENEVLRHIDNKDGCSESKKAKCRLMFGSNMDWACENCPDKGK